MEEEHDEAPCANHDFNHTNLHAVLRTSEPPVPAKNESAIIKEAHDTSTEEGDSGYQTRDVDRRKVIPTDDSSVPESRSADQMDLDVVVTVNE